MYWIALEVLGGVIFCDQSLAIEIDHSDLLTRSGYPEETSALGVDRHTVGVRALYVEIDGLVWMRRIGLADHEIGSHDRGAIEQALARIPGWVDSLDRIRNIFAPESVVEIENLSLTQPFQCAETGAGARADLDRLRQRTGLCLFTDIGCS